MNASRRLVTINPYFSRTFLTHEHPRAAKSGSSFAARVRESGAPSVDARRAAWRQALAQYRRAFVEGPTNYYPGINAATLALLLGEKTAARKLAAQVLLGCAKAETNYFEGGRFFRAYD